MKKKLLSLLLALLLCYAMILPASAADAVTREASTEVTMTVETPVPSYTLSVPAKVELTFEKGQSYEFGEVKIKDGENFYENEAPVYLHIDHTPFVSGENTVNYDFQTYCSFKPWDSNATYQTPAYRTLKGTSDSILFYPCNSSRVGYEDEPKCSEYRDESYVYGHTVYSYSYGYSFYQTMKLRIVLQNPNARPADGTYTSTVTFNASLSY